jgi:hypothetical protein
MTCGVKRAGIGHRQAAIAGVLQLLDAQGDGDVGRAGGHGIDRAAEGFRPRGAEVLHPGHSDIGQAQGDRHRRAALARAHLVDMGREPGGVQLAGLDAGVAHGLDIGLDHQIVGPAVPALAELAAAHPQDGDLVADALRHDRLSYSAATAVWAAAAARSGAAFQK